MTRTLTLLVFFALTSSTARAQAIPEPVTGAPWIVIGGSSTTILGDCTACAETSRYLHAGGVLVNAGATLNRRADLGAELLWIPSTAAAGDHVRTTYVLATVQVRPWVQSGFFLKTGGGMAFVRNWVVDLSGGADPSPPFTSKALALAIGAGWEWRVSRRFGVEVFGAQHVAALGDLTTTLQRYENVVGNYWSVGAGFVIR